MAIPAESQSPTSQPAAGCTAGTTLLVTRPANEVPGPPQGKWTWDDLVALPDDGRRYEIIDGVLYVTPPPGTGHEAMNAALICRLYEHVVDTGLGMVFGGNTGVELAPRVVVIPDVVVVLTPNLSRITDRSIAGPPDLVVEIASPSTAGYDRRQKQDAYARAGVPEYWIADPAHRTIEVLCLEGGHYQSLGVFQGATTLPSRVLPGFPTLVEQLLPRLPGRDPAAPQ